MAKLTVLGLARETKDFVFSNLPILVDHLKIIFPLALLLELVNHVGETTGNKWVFVLTFIPSILLCAFFALSWHKTSLRGASSSHATDFRNISREDWGFIRVFFAFTFLPSVIVGIMVLILILISKIVGPVVTVVLSLAFIVAAGIGLVYLIRISLILPARSVGVKLSFKEAILASQGVIWPMVGAGMIFGLIFMIAILIYGAGAGVVLYVTGGGAGVEAGALKFILSIPVSAVMYVMTALSITALSKAYRWGVENNPV